MRQCSARPVAATGRRAASTVPQRAGRHATATTRSGAIFESVVVDGERCVVKYVHPDLDFTMRVSGDVGCRPRQVWERGLVDAAPDVIDHAILGAARWGPRRLRRRPAHARRVRASSCPRATTPSPRTLHVHFLDHLAGSRRRGCGAGATTTPIRACSPTGLRWSWFAPQHLDVERSLGFPEAVPRIALDGWERFAVRGHPRTSVDAHRRAAALTRDRSSTRCRRRRRRSLHGDWKLSNLGTAADGRTVLLDWAYPGEGPVAHELAWYLALNRARLPVGVDEGVDDRRLRGRAAAPRHRHRRLVGPPGAASACSAPWCEFGWEKALGDDDELGVVVRRRQPRPAVSCEGRGRRRLLGHRGGVGGRPGSRLRGHWPTPSSPVARAAWRARVVLDLGAGSGVAGDAAPASGCRTCRRRGRGPRHAAPGPPGADRRRAVGDAVALPFAPGRFDAVVAAFSLNHLARAGGRTRRSGEGPPRRGGRRGRRLRRRRRPPCQGCDRRCRPCCGLGAGALGRMDEGRHGAGPRDRRRRSHGARERRASTAARSTCGCASRVSTLRTSSRGGSAWPSWRRSSPRSNRERRDELVGGRHRPDRPRTPAPRAVDHRPHRDGVIVDGSPLAPHTTTQTRSSGPGTYAPLVTAASAAAPPGSA